ncbi:YeiH family protein [Pseudonocardia endophytica]|uniref:Putative integral membrane protein (TIGR00698 family) n=1 Tax=Pseudonocardia endophytica TaxID=401976 RepID=A0A4R1HZ16_PSEEN|nr:YeiH family protein [Pseudonocardia endophytica]TCK26801.1 putative integral membrane protein (TIGR00698 family) [Pseudonocardia endophytica]
MAFHLDLHHPVGTAQEAGSAAAQWLRSRSPGLLVALAVAAAATAAGTALPVVGGPVFGIVFGLVVAVVLRPGPRMRPGIGFASRPVLQTSIVVLGATLSLSQIADVGMGSLPVMLGTLAVALAGAYVAGRLLGVRGDTQLLIGVGTAICGASAIAATQSVVRAKESQVAYAVATIFVFNVAAVLTFPQLGHLMGLDPHAFGLWAGTAINDTSSVVAAGYAYGGDAGSYAVIVKLTRTLMIIPIVVGLAMWAARREAAVSEPAGAGDAAQKRRLPWRKLVPLFLVGFVATSALTSVGVIPAAWHPALTAVGTFLITTALAGIGLSMQPSEIRHAGIRPLLLGAVLWVLVAASSLGLQALTGTL